MIGGYILLPEDIVLKTFEAIESATYFFQYQGAYDIFLRAIKTGKLVIAHTELFYDQGFSEIFAIGLLGEFYDNEVSITFISTEAAFMLKVSALDRNMITITPL